MASTLRGLVEDESRYLKSFQLFLDSSSEHQCMQDFIRGTLPDVLASIGDGKSRINVLGVGSGAGEIDQEMVTQLLLKHPGVMVENEVVEPSRQMLLKYKALVEKASHTENINFIWHEMTASEYEMHWKENKITKKMDFIHMIQMLYYVADPGATVLFFQSLLKKNGKLVIILVSGRTLMDWILWVKGESGWGRLWRTYKTQLCQTDTCKCVTTSDIKSYLSTKGIKYKNYEIPSKMDITDCFKEGDEGGELLLDFLTEVLNFSKFASPELKRGVLDLLRHPDCSTEEDGRVFFNNNLGVLVLDP